MTKFIEDYFPIILQIIGGIMCLSFFTILVFNDINNCVYNIEEPITTDTAKKLIDDSIKECDKNMCKFEFKIKKVEK